MEANQFDNNAKSRLSKHESKMDVDAFWDQLEPKLPKRKKRPGVFWLFLLAGLLVGSALLGLFLLIDNKASNDDRKIVDQTNQSIHSEKEFQNSSVTRATESNIKNEAAITHSKVEAKKSPEYLQKEKHASVKPVKLQLAHNKKKQFVNQEFSEGNKTDANNPWSRKSNKTSEIVSKNELLKKEIKNQSSISRNETSDLMNHNEQIETTDKFVAVQNDEVEIFKNVPLSDTMINSDEQPVDLNSDLHPVIEIAEPIIIPEDDQFEVQLIPIAGIGFYTKNLTGPMGDTLRNHITLRNKSESNLEEWLFGLNVKMSYKDIGLLTGIEYVKRNELFEFTSIKRENHFGNTAIRVEYRDTIANSFGTGWYGSTQIRKVVHYNSIQQWNIPLGLNYSFTLKAIRMDLSAGAIFSLKNEISGKTFNSFSEIAEWNESSDLTFKSNIGTGWFADMSCSIPFRNRIAFNFGFRVQEFPGNYVNGPLSLHYRSYFLRSGLIINLK